MKAKKRKMNEVKLRKLEMKDAERIYELLSQANILKSLLILKKTNKFNLNYEKNWIKQVLNEYKKKNPNKLYFGIVVEGVLIGCIGANKLDYGNEKAELGYWIGSGYQGKGYASQALKIFVDLLFKKFKLNRIEGSPFAYNKASHRVLEKTGFRLEGKRRKAMKRNGEFFDDMMYGLLREDWFKLNIRK
jgi:ribosomal-protein-serine acetyltransferase